MDPPTGAPPAAGACGQPRLSPAAPRSRRTAEESTTALASAIGARVRRERQARRWTLDRLAEAAGVSRRMVVNIEQGAALWTGEFGGRGVLVAGTEPPDVLELWDWTLAPGEHHVSEAHTKVTKELLQVFEPGVGAATTSPEGD